MILKGVIMRSFNYLHVPCELEATPVTNLLLAIREYKGKQELWKAANPETLQALLQVARVESVGASNRIEGIGTSQKRLHNLVIHNTAPQNRNEEEIAGYRDVLSLIHEQHDYIPISPGVILQLHRDLMGHVPASYGGRWKDSDNEIAARRSDGSLSVRFRPTPALLTPAAVETLCATYNDAYANQTCDPMLLAARFTFDFVNIHPFTDGNGRMSRLMTVLLSERAGYAVGRYISIERLIEQSKEQYYEALAESSAGWDIASNNEAPFVRYLLGIVLAAYRELEARMDITDGKPLAKSERIFNVFRNHPGKITKQMIMNEHPEISEVTIKRTLSALLEQGTIVKVDSGKNTGYVLADTKEV